MLSSNTYAGLLSAAAPSQRARAVAQAAFTDLISAADFGKRDLALPKHLLIDRRALWRRAGVVPETPAELAALIRDLRAGSKRPSLLRSPEAVAGFLWVILADRLTTLPKVQERHGALISEALQLLAAPGQPRGEARRKGDGSRGR